MDEYKQPWWDEAAAALAQRLATEVIERPKPLTEDEQAELQARIAAAEAAAAKRRAAEEQREREREARYAALQAVARETISKAAAAHPVLGVLAGMHQPQRTKYDYDDAVCASCPSECDYGSPVWPCGVWTTIADSL